MTTGSAGARTEWTEEAAFAYCEGVTRGHYENFPVASLLVPRKLRPHVCALYAFARAADDFADEPAWEGRRLEQLDLWEKRLDRCLEGRADHPVFAALGTTIRRFRLPDTLFRDLLDAFRQDCRVRRYESWADLLDYSRRSANPVGRLVLRLFGHRDEQLDRLSDGICTGLQLTNFWQDVAVDLDKDRIYLPGKDLQEHGITETHLREGRVDQAFRALMASMVDRTREWFRKGRSLPRRVGGRLGLELRMTWLGGTRILRRIEQENYDVFGRRPKLGPADVVSIAALALLGRPGGKKDDRWSRGRFPGGGK